MRVVRVKQSFEELLCSAAQIGNTSADRMYHSVWKITSVWFIAAVDTQRFRCIIILLQIEEQRLNPTH